MNDLTPVPRSKQTPISIRSDKAARALAKLTGEGRSQAEVIEDALELALDARPKMTPEEFRRITDEIMEKARALPRTTYRELRAPYYDENGLPI